MAPTTFSLVLGGLSATYLFLRFLLNFTQDAKEPPAILTGVPFFQPLVGMIREKSRFYIRLRFVNHLSNVSKAASPDDKIVTHMGCPSTPCAYRFSAST